MRRLTSNPNPSRRQAGDTIVEVLISITVIAVILTGAFLVSRSSLKNVRDSEEHGQALNIAQGQVELLRGYAQKHKDFGGLGSNFCFAADGMVKTGGACKHRQATLQGGGLYNISINDNGKADAGCDGASPDCTHKFIATVSWISVNGTSAQQQIVYRVAPNPGA